MITNANAFRVEVRHPLHMRRPSSMLNRIKARRRQLRRRRSNDVSGDFLYGVDLDELVILLIVFVALFVLAPWVLALVIVLIESAVWVASIAVGLVAARILRRPYSVAVVDSGTGEVLARTPVTGRANAEFHADVVASRLREGLTPTEATALDKAPV
jgi:hypothetical protein